MTKPAVLLSIGISIIVLTACSPKEESAPVESTETSAAEPAGNSASTETAPVESTEPKPLTQAFIDQKVVSARGLVKNFGTTLKSELQAAMKEGGPTNAIAICNTRAPEITSKLSADHNVKLRRVALKNRNTANEPVGWTKKVLEQFEADKLAGKDISQLEHHELVEINGAHVFRYMKAIPTAEPCLACHGSNLKPEVSSKLQELYPSDKATGFNLGDIRGAFVVTEKF